MKQIVLNIPKAYIEALDRLVARKLYPNRNEAIRLAIRDFLHEQRKWDETLSMKLLEIEAAGEVHT